MAQINSERTAYLIRFERSDGEHLATIDTAEWNDDLAQKRAKEQFGKELISCERTTDEKTNKAIKELLAANTSRVPLDELTGNQPNRIIDEPNLTDPQD